MKRTTAGLLVALMAAGLLALAGSSPVGALSAQTDGPATEAAPPEIVGGTPATPGQFPYQVALVFRDAPGIPVRGQFCGGSLIAPDTVLTASHCVIYDLQISGGDGGDDFDVRPILTPASEVDVIAGTTSLGLGGGGERLHVRRIRLAPDFAVDFNSSFNFFQPDLAILQLTSNSTATPVDLAVPGQEGLYPAGTPATVTGWGATEDVLQGPPTILRQATVPIVSDSDCATVYGSDFNVTRNICAGDLLNGGADSCYGDSGGPLVVDNGGEPLQVGVVLGGDGCGTPERPGVYSRVATNSAFLGRYLDPDEVPDAPSSARVTALGTGVRVSWRAPDFDGGTAITGYQVKISGGPTRLVSRQSRHADIAIAAPGRRRITVRAVNAVGTGAPKAVSFRCLAAPGLACAAVT